MLIKIDYDRCNGCKKCYDWCPMDIFTWDEDKKRPVSTYEDECWVCGICWGDCPKRAIDIVYPASLI